MGWIECHGGDHSKQSNLIFLSMWRCWFSQCTWHIPKSGVPDLPHLACRIDPIHLLWILHPVRMGQDTPRKLLWFVPAVVQHRPIPYQRHPRITDVAEHCMLAIGAQQRGRGSGTWEAGDCGAAVPSWMCQKKKLYMAIPYTRMYGIIFWSFPLNFKTGPLVGKASWDPSECPGMLTMDYQCHGRITWLQYGVEESHYHTLTWVQLYHYGIVFDGFSWVFSELQKRSHFGGPFQHTCIVHIHIHTYDCGKWYMIYIYIISIVSLDVYPSTAFWTEAWCRKDPYCLSSV